MSDLEYQDKALVGGCFIIGTGAPLWGCADCGEYVVDERYCQHETETIVEREYHRAITRLMNEYKPISTLEFALLRGRLNIRSSISRSFPSANYIEIVRTQAGFAVYMYSNGETTVEHFDGMGDQFDVMLQFAENVQKQTNATMESQNITVRIAKEYREFSVALGKTTDGKEPLIVVRPA